MTIQADTEWDLMFEQQGFRFLCVCPLCHREILELKDARAIRDAILRADADFVECFCSQLGCNLVFMLPIAPEIARLFDKRVAIVPVCVVHRNVDLHKVQASIVLAGRYGTILKEIITKKRRQIAHPKRHETGSRGILEVLAAVHYEKMSEVVPVRLSLSLKNYLKQVAEKEGLSGWIRGVILKKLNDTMEEAQLNG